MCVYVCIYSCVCVCVRARVCACVRACLCVSVQQQKRGKEVPATLKGLLLREDWGWRLVDSDTKEQAHCCRSSRAYQPTKSRTPHLVSSVMRGWERALPRDKKRRARNPVSGSNEQSRTCFIMAYRVVFIASTAEQARLFFFLHVTSCTVLNPSCRLLLVRLGGYIANLSDFILTGSSGNWPLFCNSRSFVSVIRLWILPLPPHGFLWPVQKQSWSGSSWGDSFTYYT
jgi:hypothetical protein